MSRRIPVYIPWRAAVTSQFDQSYAASRMQLQAPPGGAIDIYDTNTRQCYIAASTSLTDHSSFSYSAIITHNNLSATHKGSNSPGKLVRATANE